MKTSIRLILIILINSIIFSSCKKEDQFLDAVPNSKLSLITTLDQLQLLLQNDNILNINSPAYGELSSDDFYLDYSTYLSRAQEERDLYIWSKTQLPFATSGDWNSVYGTIFYANTVLDNLKLIKYSNDQQSKADAIKGSALFFRSINFYGLLQEFAKPYDKNTAKTDYGIPLRLTSDLTTKIQRSSIQESYDQVINDLNAAIPLLPDAATVITQPNKLAAVSFLARIYLTMGDYTNAYNYANQALTTNGTLTDFNTLPNSPSVLTTAPFPLPETRYLTIMLSVSSLSARRHIVDSTLYASYDNNDLRKSLFFVSNGGALRFKGSYQYPQTTGFFDGIANDELYLIRAESSARLGNTSAAMDDLNALLKSRYLIGTFNKRVATGPDDALTQILQERRKELIFRGTRWVDLRRLNKDPKYQITLKRNLNGTIYSLPPNDSRYVLPIPDVEIQLSGIPQNPR